MHINRKNGSCQADEIAQAGTKRKYNDKVLQWIRKHLSDEAFAAMEHCGDYLVYLEDETREHKKLDVGFFCKQRLCSGCAWRAAVKSAQCIAAIAAALAEKHRVMLMVTLTVPNVPGAELRHTMQHLGRSWIRLVKRKRYRFWADYVRKLEITYNKETDTYHPHLHCVVFVPSTYFARSNYISHDQLLRDWREVTGQPEITQVDVRRCRKLREGTSAILEVAKYSAKAADYSQSEKVLDTMYAALHHSRLITYSGLCKELRDGYKAGKLERFEQIDTTVYTMRVVYVWQRVMDADAQAAAADRAAQADRPIAPRAEPLTEWQYVEWDVQPYSMDAAELARLQRDEQRAQALALDVAARRDSWQTWLSTDWVRAIAAADEDELEVLE